MLDHITIVGEVCVLNVVLVGDLHIAANGDVIINDCPFYHAVLPCTTKNIALTRRMKVKHLAPEHKVGNVGYGRVVYFLLAWL